jgi:hypothetical protein
MTTRRSLLLAAALSAAAMVAHSPRLVIPNKPIKFIVPYALSGDRRLDVLDQPRDLQEPELRVQA